MDNHPLLIMSGPRILQENLRAARMTEDDLGPKLREANVTRYDQVLAVVMERTGDVSVLHAESGDVDWDSSLIHGVRRSARCDAGTGRFPH